MKNQKFDIGIIGGGPAGSSAAIYLSKLGFSTALFEKKVFPRETLCGEFLSKEVIEHLQSLNLFEDFISLNPNRLESVSLINKTGNRISSPLGFTAYSMKRSLFDNLLLTCAKDSGASIFQPAEIKEIIFLNGSYLLKLNDESEIELNDLIASWGKQNPLDKKLNRIFVNHQSKLNGIKFHINKKYLNDFNENEIQLYTADGIYCGVNKVNDDDVTFCFLEDRNRLSTPAREQLLMLREANKGFKKLFKDDPGEIINQIPLYGTGNIYFGKRELQKNGVYMVGDAAGVIAPLAGGGIGMAMESGKLISGILHNKKQYGLTAEESYIQYEKKWKEAFGKRLLTASVIQNFLLNRYRRNVSFALIKIFPMFLPRLIKATRN
jgi:menaquinone-9 beta-reductase